MRRRRAIQALLGAPAIAAIPLPAPAQTQDIPKLTLATADTVGDPATRYFSSNQMAALRRLGDLVVPAAKGRPSAKDAQAAEFLDFLVSQSPAERQTLYRNGLDHLQSESHRRYNRAFEALNADEADTVLAPLHAAWTYNAPSEPYARFLRDVKEDLLTATMNSRAWAEAQAAAGRRGTGVGTYWYPVE